MECFDLLYLRFHRSIYNLAYKIVRDRVEAEDVTQDVFLAIYEQKERFDQSVGPARTWVLQFGYFKSLKRRRYLSKRHFYDKPQNAENDDASEEALVQPEFIQRSLEGKEIVDQALASLTPGQRHVIKMVHLEGHTLREISEREGEELTRIRNSYYRGLNVLRSLLATPKRAVRNTGELNRREEYEIEL